LEPRRQIPTQFAARIVDGQSDFESRRAEKRLARVRFDAPARHAISGLLKSKNASPASG
jgi:hypothetical protein